MLRALAVLMAVSAVVAGCGTRGYDGAATESEAPTSDGPGPPDPADGVDKYALAKGVHTLLSDPGWVYFKTASGKGCAIGPIGKVVGCDFVPLDAPPGTGQTVIDGGGPAVYRKTPGPTFTRDVDVLAEGYRLTNGATRCAAGPKGVVRCETERGTNGFAISDTTGALW